jgi:hypothetical protein
MHPLYSEIKLREYIVIETADSFYKSVSHNCCWVQLWDILRATNLTHAEC